MKRSVRLVVILAVLAPALARAESATLSADSYVSAASSAANFGKRKQLWVQGPAAGETADTAYLQFDLSSLPAGVEGSDIAKATLTLGVGKVKSAGSFDVYRVVDDPGAWTEGGLNAANAPALASSPEVAGVAVGNADKNTFKTIDVTDLVRDWLDGTLPNNGLALVPNGTALSAAFDSKETTSTAHFATLDLAVAASSFSGPLAGDVTGSQLATKVSKINGAPLSSLSGALPGQALTFLGSAWGPGNVVTSLLAGVGLTLSAANGDVTIGISTGGITNNLLANPALNVLTGVGLGGGGSVPLGGTLNLLNTGLLSMAALPPLVATGGQNTTLSIPAGTIANELLANPSLNVLTGSGLGGGGAVPLGGTLSLVNTGLLSLSALSPLSVSGGQTPSLSLSGIIPLANGGTGAANAAGALANLGAAGRGANSDITSLNGLTGVNLNILTVLNSLPVYVTPGGSLGVVGSSARFKDDIVDMGDSTGDLMKLRPVRFRYKKDIDPAGAEQFGLVAEEVAGIYPDLVAYDEQGRPLTVRYQALTPMLLNEVQRQAREIEAQRRQILAQEARLEQQAQQFERLAARLASLEAAADNGGATRITEKTDGSRL